MLPFLPPEIILNIIRLGLPPATYTAYRERYDLLIVFSLVNRTWRSLAQGELFIDVMLKSSRGKERLSVALTSTAAHLASSMKTLRLEAPAGVDDCMAFTTTALREDIWKLCSGTTEVRARGLYAEGVYLSLDNLVEIKGLRRLHFYKVDMLGLLRDLPLPATPLFSHLEHLSLCEYGSFFPDRWTDLICPSLFPALRSLLLARTVDWKIPANTLRVLERIGPQITTFAIIDECREQRLLRAIAPSWGSFTALKHLAISGQGAFNDGDTIPDLFTLLPATLHSLEIIHSSLDPTEPAPSLLHLLFHLQADLPSLSSIERICLPPWISPPPSSHRDSRRPTVQQKASTTSMRAREQLKSLADARQFVLDETGTHPDRASTVWYSAWKDLSMGA